MDSLLKNIRFGMRGLMKRPAFTAVAVITPWVTIVGVVGDVRHRGLNTPPNPEMYMSQLQEPQSAMSVMLRTTGEPLQSAPAAREQLKAMDRDLPVTVTTMDQIFANSLAGQRFNTSLLGVFAAVALLLALVGVAAGTAGAVALTRLIEGMIYGVSPTDGPTFVVVSLIVTMVAFVACYLPARRATRVDPLVALRYE